MPSVEPFEPRKLGPKNWGTELLVAHTPLYTGKVLLYTGGIPGPLQHHVEKDETFYLHSGAAWVDYDAGDGTLTRVKMRPGMSFHVPPGAVHRFEAITDCVVFETSNPIFDDRVSDEHRY